MISIVGRKNRYLNPNQATKIRLYNLSLEQPQKAGSMELGEERDQNLQ